MILDLTYIIKEINFTQSGIQNQVVQIGISIKIQINLNIVYPEYRIETGKSRNRLLNGHSLLALSQQIKKQ